MTYQVCEYPESPEEPGNTLLSTEDFIKATGTLWGWKENRRHPAGLICALEKIENGEPVPIATVSSSAVFHIYPETMELSEMVSFLNAWGLWVDDLVFAIEEACGINEEDYWTYDKSYLSDELNKDLNAALQERGCEPLAYDL